MPAVALTDHGRAGGLLQLKKECKKVDIKPIYGVELYVAPESRFTKEKLDNHTKTSYHLTVLAKNEIGLRNIFRLSSLAWTEGYYYKPRCDMELLERHSEGLVVLSGCGSGRTAVMLLEDNTEAAIGHTKELHKIFKDDFYIEVQNHDLPWQEPLKHSLFAISKDLDIPIVATQDSHYPKKEDAELHNNICKLAAGDLSFDSDHSWFKSEEEMREMFNPEEQYAIDNTILVADKCKCNWEYGKTIWPVYDLPKGVTPAEKLRELTNEGSTKRFGKATEEYRQRISYELGVIEEMGFSTYFLVVADFINWAKDQGIPVGPGRGSGAGSLVCYCVGITEVDPIKYGLYFERFLSPARHKKAIIKFED
jgi:DNA polymerase-3 subunit alpha